MSYTWSVPKFLTSDENLKNKSQKTDLTLFLLYGSHQQKLTFYVLSESIVRTFGFFFFTDPLSLLILSH